MRKKKSDQNAVAELTREWLYKENKWLWEENRKLKEKLSKITMVADDEKQSIEHILELEEENKKLKELVNEIHRDKEHILWEKLILQEENEYRKRIADVVPEWKGHIAEETIQDLQEENKGLKEAMKELNNYNKFRIQENKKLKEELKKYKKLHKYSNWELLTYSGD